MTSTKTETHTKTCIPEWRQNLIDLAKIDMNAPRNEYIFPAPKALSDFLGVEPRDYALWYNIFDCYVLTALNLLMIPFLMHSPWYYIAAVSTLRIFAVGVPKFVLALHFSAHRPVIKPKWLNELLIEVVITPFFGLPPGVYRYHHIIMHHREDNLYPHDISSTMPYQRDNFPFCFLHYWLRFECAAWVELPYFLFVKGHLGMLAHLLSMLAIYFAGNWYLWHFVRPAVALWLFLVPQVVLSAALMWGNFSQHILVDPDHYADDYRLTVNLMATPYNQLSFNDGYHILHHKYPGLHWSELPSRCASEREMNTLMEHDAVSFKDIDWFMLGAHIWFGFWDKLIREHFVPTNQQQADMTHSERILFLKKRLQRIDA